MAKQKKSFLDRIVSTEEKSDNSNDIAQKPKINKDFFESDAGYYTPLANQSIIKNSNGDSDTEGQLTVDVYHTDKEIVIRSIVGGANSQDIDININNDMVTIKGVRKIPEDVTPENYYYKECFWGVFSRSIILPGDVDAERAQASIKNGILVIRLPWLEKVKVKKIQVVES